MRAVRGVGLQYRSSCEKGSSMATTEETIARFIVETADHDLPVAARKWANLGSFDCMGTMLAGAASPPGKIMTRLIKEAGGTPETTVVGTGLRTSPILGALANGTLAHALDYDDMGGNWGHPSCVLLPPLISLGERMGASGKDVLNAYVMGFEVGSAIVSGCHYHEGERGFHSTSMFGVVAATAACARLLKLNVEQTIMALGVAGSTAGGILQNFGTYTKGFHAGFAGHNAVIACLLARDGWKATDRVFESKVGFLSTYVGKDMYSLETIRDSLGKWHVINKLTIKQYPCCFSNHSALDSIISLLKENNISLEDIQQVDVAGMPYISHVLLYPEPEYAFQGKFSIHYCVATAMVDKHIDIESYTDEKLNRPQLRQAMEKLVVHVVPPWDPDYSPAAPENPVTIKLKDGRTLRRSTKRGVVHGTPANPLTEEEILAKFKFNAALSLPVRAVERACSLWRNLEHVGNISEALAAVAGKA